jgi:type IV secretory pathway VirB4 component
LKNQLREWLKTFRKWNASVILATQSLADLAESHLQNLVLESCPTIVLLANPKANNQARKYYEQIGLNSVQINIIHEMLPKREYYFTSPLGNRVISFNLGRVALAFVGVSGVKERLAVEAMIAKYGDDWPAAHLRSLGIYDWADYVEQLGGRRRCAPTGD